MKVSKGTFAQLAKQHAVALTFICTFLASSRIGFAEQNAAQSVNDTANVHVHADHPVSITGLTSTGPVVTFSVSPQAGAPVPKSVAIYLTQLPPHTYVGVDTAPAITEKPGNITDGHGDFKLNISGSELPCSVTVLMLTFKPTQDHGFAVLPPLMGWSTWNPYGNNINEAVVETNAEQLVSSGMAAAGYQFVNIDGNWWQGERDANGDFIIDPAQWPNGMDGVARYIHSKGLKAGMYTDAGSYGCSDGAGAGSEGHYVQDMTQFVNWGYDFVKVDWCGGSMEGLDPESTYKKVEAAIDTVARASGKRLVLEICYWASPPAWPWAPGVGNQWRTGGDIQGPQSNVAFDSSNIYVNFDNAYHPTAEHTGYHNHADMMEIGQDLWPLAQYQTHMSLWSIIGSPLIAGDVIANAPASATPVYTNPAAIAVDQDPLNIQGIKVFDSVTAPPQQVYGKLLSGSGQRAVVLLNRDSSNSHSITMNWSDLGLDPSKGVEVTDIWNNTDFASTGDSYTATVGPDGVVFLRLSGTDAWTTKNYTVTSTGSDGTQTYSNVQSATAGGYLSISYTNTSFSTQETTFSANGGQSTTVALAPTGADKGTAILYAGLIKGANSVVLAPWVDNEGNVEPMPKIDSIALVAGPIEQPPPPPPTYEANSSTSILGGGATRNEGLNVPGGTDVGYIGNGDGTTNGTLTITGISVPTTGTYIVPIMYIDGDSGRSALITVNGGTPITVNFPSTGSWTSYSTYTISVPLNQGASNTIEFSNPTGWAPDIIGLETPTSTK